jgi:DNA-binding NtrC family response regulator
MGGALFIDEIGDLALDRQVKLLRVLEERVFQRVGDTVDLPFSARVISATHQDLDARIRRGQLRLDLYQRLAGLRIVTPSLREQLDAAPEDLTHLVRFFAERIADEEAAPGLVDLTVRHIEERLPRYEWPGNVRELRDCVDTLHHGGEFIALDLQGGAEAARSSKTQARSSEDPLRSLRLGTLSDTEAAIRYRTHVVALTGNVNQAAHRLHLHRNTVTRSVDLPRLNRWRARRPR